MTVNITSTGKQYFQGLSTDAKPESAPGGSEYYELDTGDTHIYSSRVIAGVAIGWVEIPSQGNDEIVDGLAENNLVLSDQLVTAISQLNIMTDQRERVTNGQRIITTDHGAIHEGEGFSVYATRDNLENNATHDILFRVTDQPNSYVHLKFYDVWIDNAAGLLQLYEGAVYTPDTGTAITPTNRRRTNTPPVSESVLINQATVDVGAATLLEVLRFGGGGTGPQGRTGGDRGIDIEWVLRPDTDYVFRITNQSGVKADIGMWVFWYEEEFA